MMGSMMAKLRSSRISPSLPTGLRFCSTFPTSKCYRHIMTTTPVGNNGDSMVWHPKGTGTCYSYCITELLQAKAKVITGIDVKLSIPHVITRLREKHTSMENVLDFAKFEGVLIHDDWPRFKHGGGRRVFVKNWKPFHGREQLVAGMQRGPLIGVWKPHMALEYHPAIAKRIVTLEDVELYDILEQQRATEKGYWPGVCKHEFCRNFEEEIPEFCYYCSFYGSNRGHCVVITGYNRDPTVDIPYWEFRNNWGPKWGRHGYGRFEMTVGEEEDPKLLEKPIGVLDLERRGYGAEIKKITWM